MPSKTRLSISPIGSFTLLNDSLSVTSTSPHKHGLCPPFGFHKAFMWSIAGLRPVMLHMKVERRGSGFFGFWGLGFGVWGLGQKGLGLWGLGLWVFRVQGSGF